MKKTIVFLSLLISQLLYAAPDPELTFTAVADPLKGETVEITMQIDNVGTDTGFFPYFRYILPAELTHGTNVVCGGLGSASKVTIIDNVTASQMIALDIYNNEELTLEANEKLVLVLPPLGQLSKDQPVIKCSITASMTASAVVGTPFSVKAARAIFAIGHLANGLARNCGGIGDTLCSDDVTSYLITPQLIKLETSSSEVSPSGTGPNYPVGLNITGTIATGEILNNVTITDQIPVNLVHGDPGDCSTFSVLTPAPTSCIIDTGVSPHVLTLTYLTLSGNLNIGYPAGSYRDNVLLAAGVSTTNGNNVNLVADEIPGGINKTVSILNRSIDTKLTSINSNDQGGSGTTPGDTIRYTLDVAISDDFDFEDPILSLKISDGQTLVPNSIEITLSQNNYTESYNEVFIDGVNNALLGRTVNGDGTTDLVIDLEAMIEDNGSFPLWPDLTLKGAAGHGASDRATTIKVTYDVTIDELFINGGLSVDVGDKINSELISFVTNIVGQANYDFGIGTIVTSILDIVGISTFTKEISHINNALEVLPVSQIKSGDLVTYKLSLTIPDGGVEDLVIEDFLPGPLFAPIAGGICLTQSLVAVNLQVANEFSFGVNDPGFTFNTATPATDMTIDCDLANGSIKFSFPDYDVAGGDSDEIIEIYFTIAATTAPMINGLQVVNSAFSSYKDSFASAAGNLVSKHSFVVEAPVVEPTLTITGDDDGNSLPASPGVGVDAGALVNFSASLDNSTGKGVAQNATMTLELPDGYINPGKFVNCTEGGGSDCDYNVVVSGGASCAVNVIAADENEIVVSGINIAEGESCTVDFQLLSDLSVMPGQEIETELQVSWNNGGIPYPPKFSKVKTEIKESTLAIVANSGVSAVPGDAKSWTVNADFIEGTTGGLVGGNTVSATIVLKDNNWITFDDTAGVVTVVGGVVAHVVNATTYYCTNNVGADFIDKVCFENDPTDANNHSIVGGNLVIDLGGVINGWDDNASHTVAFNVSGGLVDDIGSGTTYKISADHEFHSATGGSVKEVASSQELAVTVNTPKLSVDVCATNTTTLAAPITMGESVSYNVIVKNTGSNLATAFDIADIPNTLVNGLNYTNGSIQARYCANGQGEGDCGTFPPTGCTTVNPVVGGNLNIPVLNGAGDADIEAGGYYIVQYTAEMNCSRTEDTSGADAAPAHNNPPGYTCGAGVPVLLEDVLETDISVFTYTSQDGNGPGGIGTEASYNTTVASAADLALDSDGDGISNALEGASTNRDSDGDGVPDYLDTDSDDNSISDATEVVNASSPTDSDGDGTPDWYDTDDDNDGVSDAQEIIDAGGSIVSDIDGDGIKDFLDADSDGDGLADGSEGGALVNTDGDSEPDPQDRDSDNDGILDIYEFGFGSCDDGTPNTNGAVANDGILHDDEVKSCDLPALCINSPCDNNQNGAIEAAELTAGIPDSDGDGVFDFRDLDSDNDGLGDLYENYLFAVKSGGGLISLADLNAIDTNDDGMVTGNTTPNLSGQLLALGNLIGDGDGRLEQSEIFDFDNDGVPNFLDKDSDNDGIPDIIENNRYNFDTNDSNSIAYPGELAALKTPNAADGTLSFSDSDNFPDYLDIDSDGDGIADWIEAYSGMDFDTVAVDGSITQVEFDNNISNFGNNDNYIEYTELADSDNDGIPDFKEVDSDNDLILDRYEHNDADNDPSTVVVLLANIPNSDGTGGPDFTDTNSDDDGFSDTVEAGADLSDPLDSDNDGKYDFQEIDSDNDGLDDDEEAGVNGDRTKADTDGDSCSDGCEVYGSNYAGPGACFFVTVAGHGTGNLGAPFTDVNDADTDGGGTGDCLEGQGGTDPNVPGDDPADTDNDGILDGVETTIGTDPFSADSDGDGLSDGCEVFGTSYIGAAADCPWIGHPHGAAGTVNAPFTDPLNEDTDNGGISDYHESQNGGNPHSDADDDSDGDGIGNDTEIALGLDPELADSNGDCINDGDEIGPDQNNPKDTDGDGTPDIFDMDNDGDGLTDCEELAKGLNPHHGKDAKIQGSGGFGCSSAMASEGGTTGAENKHNPFLSFVLLVMIIAVFRNYRFFFRLVKKSSVLFFCLCISFSAKSFDVQKFKPLVSDLGVVTQYGATPLKEEKWQFNISYNYVVNPLEFGSNDKERLDGIVDKLHSADLSIGYGWSKNISLFANIRGDYASTFEAVSSSTKTKEVAAFGDVHAGLLWRFSEHWALVPHFTAPTGDSEIHLGENGLAGGVKVIRDFDISKRHYLTTNLGVVFRKAEKLYNLEVNDAVEWGLGYTYLLDEEDSIKFFAEAFGEHPISSIEDKEVAAPAEVLIGLGKDWKDSGTNLKIGYGTGTNIGYGAPDHRVFAGLTFSFGEEVSEITKVKPVHKPVRKPIVKSPILIKTGKIHFQTGKSIILDSSKSEIKKVSEVLLKYPQITKVRIEGHTDNRGKKYFNEHLSIMRASSVKDYLIKLGVDPKRLSSDGFGDKRPFTTNETREGRSLNRRVEFKIVETIEGFRYDDK